MYFDFFRSGNVFVISEILLERMPEQKKQRMERLILGGRRDTALNR